MTIKKMNPAQRYGGAGRVRNMTSLAAVGSNNATNPRESQRIPAKSAQAKPTGVLILDVGALAARDTCRRQLLRLEYRDEDGAMTVWQGYSHDDAIVFARTWTRSGVRLLDLTEGGR